MSGPQSGRMPTDPGARLAPRGPRRRPIDAGALPDLSVNPPSDTLIRTMTDTDTSALSAIADGLGDLAAAAVLTLKDGFQVTDVISVFGESQAFVKTIISNAAEARREIADVDAAEGIDLAVLLAGQAKKIVSALKSA